MRDTAQWSNTRQVDLRDLARELTSKSVSFSHAILAQTKKLNVIAAILPGPWNPTIAAKTLAGIDIYTGSRISVNVVSGWFKQEFVSIGEEWLEVSEIQVRGPS